LVCRVTTPLRNMCCVSQNGRDTPLRALSSGALSVDAWPVGDDATHDTLARACARSTATPPTTLVTLRTVDFGGQREYLYTHRLFCTSQAVYAVCVSLDEWLGKAVADVVLVLHDYMSMVHMRAPTAPTVLVFTKADRMYDVSPSVIPAAVADWMDRVACALHAQFPQLSIGSISDEPHSLLVSSKDGWEACQERLCRQVAKLALASPGVGRVLPRSYGALRDALAAAGGAWKHESDGTPCSEVDGVEENKGEEGSHSDSAPTATNLSLDMRWGVRVPVVSVASVHDMAMRSCGFSPDADIRQVLRLLHSMGSIVYGGALCEPWQQETKARGPPHLSELVVLDAQWLADMLSRVVTQYTRRFDDAGRPCRGRVSLHDVASAFHGYPDDLRGSFVELLFALEIAFPGKSDDGSAADHFWVPALLPLAVSGTDKDVATRAIAGVTSCTNVSSSW